MYRSTRAAWQRRILITSPSRVPPLQLGRPAGAIWKSMTQELGNIDGWATAGDEDVTRLLRELPKYIDEYHHIITANAPLEQYLRRKARASSEARVALDRQLRRIAERKQKPPAPSTPDSSHGASSSSSAARAEQLALVRRFIAQYCVDEGPDLAWYRRQRPQRSPLAHDHNGESAADSNNDYDSSPSGRDASAAADETPTANAGALDDSEPRGGGRGGPPWDGVVGGGNDGGERHGPGTPVGATPSGIF